MSFSVDVAAAPILAALVVIFIIYHFFLYPALLSPLARIPNAHWSAPYSRLWALHIRYSSRENRTLLAAHRRLGPVVRVAPNELSVHGVDCVRTVYSAGFEKPMWYAVFDNYGMRNMFSSRSAGEHTARKRLISHVYSKSYIHASAAAARQAQVILFDRLLPVIQASGLETQGIDVHSLFLGTTMDFISCYVFGLSAGTNFLQNASFRDRWLELYKSRNDHGFYDQELPWLTSFCRAIGIPLCPSHVDYANAELERWLRDDLVKKAARLKNWGMMSLAEHRPVVMQALVEGREKYSAESSAYNFNDADERAVSSELLDHVLAGQETAGVALTYLVWRLSQDMSLQHKLREELVTLEPNLELSAHESLPDAKHLDALPLLHAVIMETLRLHAPIPGALPRETPAKGCELAGYAVPGGVRVAAMAYTLHRDEDVFPKPDKWDHTRWLVGCATEDEMRTRKAAFWAFASGGRMCIGSNFAMHEIKLIAVAIYSNFTTYIVDDEGLAEQSDGYTSRPAKERLIVRFERVG